MKTKEFKKKFKKRNKIQNPHFPVLQIWFFFNSNSIAGTQRR